MRERFVDGGARDALGGPGAKRAARRGEHDAEQILLSLGDKVGDLVKVFAGISDELHNHYLLAYTPKKAPDGLWRTIEVRLVNRKDSQVRVRKGYFAVRRRK